MAAAVHQPLASASVPPTLSVVSPPRACQRPERVARLRCQSHPDRRYLASFLVRARADRHGGQMHGVLDHEKLGERIWQRAELWTTHTPQWGGHCWNHAKW